VRTVCENWASLGHEPEAYKHFGQPCGLDKRGDRDSEGTGAGGGGVWPHLKGAKRKYL